MKFTKNEQTCISILSVCIIISSFILVYEIFENRSMYKNSENGETTVGISYYNEITANSTTAKEKIKYEEKIYVINTETKKIHSPDCKYAKKLSDDKKSVVRTDTLGQILKDGYTVCGSCNIKDKK